MLAQKINIECTKLDSPENELQKEKSSALLKRNPSSPLLKWPKQGLDVKLMVPEKMGEVKTLRKARSRGSQ